MRKNNLDLMRIAGIIAVIGIHTVGNHLNLGTHGAGAVHQICTFAVPVMVMISGAIWLDEGKEVTLKGIWKKNILRIATAFMFWSLLYAGYFDLHRVGKKQFLYNCIAGHYHLWFCYMIVGLYIIVPLIRKIKENKALYHYFFIISGITAIGIPTLRKVPVLAEFMGVTVSMYLYMGLGYVFYFMLGDMIYNVKWSGRMRMTVYVLGILSFLMICCGIWQDDDFDLFRMFYSAAVFLAVKMLGERLFVKEKEYKVLKEMSEMCFGIYLVHVFVLNFYNPRFLEGSAKLGIMGILLEMAVVFAISLGIVFLLRKIKVMRKYFL